MANADTVSALILEPHRDTSRAMVVYLTELGYHVVAVETVRDARAALNAHRFKVFLSDLILPDAHASALKDLIHERPAMYAVIISSCDRSIDVTLAIGAGFRAHITKPHIIDPLTAHLAIAAEERATAKARAKLLGHMRSAVGVVSAIAWGTLISGARTGGTVPVPRILP